MMRTVCEMNMCSNCGACVNICPKNAIRVDDNMKACNAVIDEAKCVNCGLCHKMCTVNNPIHKKKPILWKQGWADDTEMRKKSSSGGLAAAIEVAFIENGGVVCSCTYDQGNFSFDLVTQTCDIERFVGSKYVKSNPANVYSQIKDCLNKGMKVLFVGLPCQCAAVKKYTNDDPMLYTADLICHGTPSRKLLEMYLNEKGYCAEKLMNLNFRKKMDYCLFDDGKRIVSSKTRDRYTIAFLKSLCYTENCYSCQYASSERVSDLTLGDSWGSGLDETEQKKGISLVLCQSEKGIEMLGAAKLYLTDVNLQVAMANNRQLISPASKPRQYELFFSTMLKTKNFSKSVKRCYYKICIRQDIKALLVKVGLIRR